VKVTVVDNRQTSACCYPALLTQVNLTEGKVWSCHLHLCMRLKLDSQNWLH